MRVLGLVFAGTATERRAETSRFVSQVLGLPQTAVGGVTADLFELPDGSFFAVAGPGELGDTTRSIGFLVADLDGAIAELTAAGVETDGVAENGAFRYTHFHAPDGGLYELVERLGDLE